MGEEERSTRVSGREWPGMEALCMGALSSCESPLSSWSELECGKARESAVPSLSSSTFVPAAPHRGATAKQAISISQASANAIQQRPFPLLLPLPLPRLHQSTHRPCPLSLADSHCDPQDAFSFPLPPTAVHTASSNGISAMTLAEPSLN